MKRAKQWLSVMLAMGLVAQNLIPASAAIASEKAEMKRESISQRIATDSNGSRAEDSDFVNIIKGSDSNAQMLPNAILLQSEEISFTQDEMTINLGDQEIPLPIEGDNLGRIDYESDKPDVVSVSNSGYATAKAPGVAIITASRSTGAQATITVTVPERQLVFTESPIRVLLGERIPIPLEKENFSALSSARRVLFEVADESIADISTFSFEKEEIAGLKLGRTKLTVKSNDNYKPVESSCDVEVYTDITLSDLKVESAFKKAVVLSWKMENTENYKILRSENGGEFRQISRGYDGAQENTYVDGTAKEGVVYTYKVEALARYGQLAVSQEVSVTVSDKLVSFRLPTLYLNESYQIKPEYDGYATIPKGTWTIDDPTIATVDSAGTVKALKEGQTKITLHLEDGNLYSANLYVVKPEEVSDLSVFYNYANCVKLSWEPVRGYDICAIYRREGNGPWSKLGTTGEKTFADETVKAGHTYEYRVVRVLNREGAAYETFGKNLTVTVSEKIVRLKESLVRLEKGESAQVPLELLHFTEIPKILYTSSDPDIFFVNENGTVTAKTEGTARITIEVENGPVLVCTYFCVKNPSGMYTKKEWQVFTLTNQNRMEEGHDPLSMFPQMQKATDIRKKELTRKYSHTRPDGSSCFSVLWEVGLSYFSAAENIAKGQRTPEIVVNAWMNSPGHYKNIMGEYEHFAAGEKDLSWVQMFLGCSSEMEIMDLLSTGKNRTFKQGTEIEEFGETVVLYCPAHGFSYMPLISQMCTGYDEDEVGKQTITVQYKDLCMTFDVTITKKTSGGGSSSGGGGGSSSGGGGGSSSGGGGGSSSGGGGSSSGGGGGSSSGGGGGSSLGGNGARIGSRNANSNVQTLPDTYPGARWMKQNEKWYLVKADGTRATGWAAKNNRWYYMNPTQDMKTGWLLENNKWYFLNPDGDMKTGWLSINGKWYYLNPSGDMKTGWLSENNKWYYLKPENGEMAVGWLSENGKWYYTGADGAMYSNCRTPDGYWVDASGARR